jgi:O-acetyl-ADP-ribose deacetylase (regulator of RNase III)
LDEIQFKPVKRRGPDPSSYADAIDLHAVFDRTPRASGGGVDLKDLAAWLIQDAGLATKVMPDRSDALRPLITRLLTVRPARPISPNLLQSLDDLFAKEAAHRPVVDVEGPAASIQDIASPSGTRLLLWRGDITLLVVDAIVNAANRELLGCFRPSHACIDNAIHTAAGPRLRDHCRRIIERQGHLEPTGTAKITRGYYLPSRFVLHTVGPIVGNGQVTPAHREHLARSYESCLALAAAMRVRSLAFCGISTGVFGYPKRDAASVATDTVLNWLAQHPPSLERVVFDVFTEDDEMAYREVWRSR